MNLFLSISSFSIEFAILKSKFKYLPNPKNKTGWSYKFKQDLNKTKQNFYQKILPTIPNEPGYLIFSINLNNQIKTIRILNSYENMRLHLKVQNIFDWMIKEINFYKLSKITIQIAHPQK